MSVIGERGGKKLEKLMTKETKAEEKAFKHAVQDVKKAEKAVKKCVKAVEKAEKKRAKTLKREHATAKVLNKAKHKHADVLEKEAHAEQVLAEKREKEDERDRGVQQLQEDLDNFQITMEGNAKERESRLAEVFAHLGQEGVPVPSSAQLASRL
ncbi:hypothetical protein C8Q79DRAFT_369737 [Trametes meyenii]|nr:hypothetical protein C8Q79DRAFT_369737 [Trametes meyenii]